MQITKLISKISSFDLMLAMYTGLSISFYLAAFATHRVGIPLISDFGLYSFQPTIATIGIALSLLHLVNVRFRGSWFFLSSFLISLIYLLSYTRFGAFLPLVPLGYLFLGFIDRQNINRQKTCAQIFLSLIFIFAALHKLNGSFFEGQVFIKTSDFMYWLNCKNIFLEDLLSSDLFKALPIIVIFIEIFIAALIWLRPFFAAHLVAIFSLGLSIIHPIAFYVYLTLFPVCYFLIEEKKDHHRENVFAWALFLYFVVIHMIFISYHSRVSDFSWGLVVVICLGLIIFHLKKGWRSERGAVCVPR